MSMTRKDLKKQLTRVTIARGVLAATLRELLPIAMVTAERNSKTHPEFTSIVAAAQDLFYPEDVWEPAIKSRRK